MSATPDPHQRGCIHTVCCGGHRSDPPDSQTAKLLIHDPDELLRRRVLARLTQAQLAEKAGLVKSTVSRAERGLASMEPDTLHLLAEALGCPVEALLAARLRVDRPSIPAAAEMR